jgi:hypothetical protein
MIGDNLFTTHYFPIEVKKLNEPIYLFPWGDVHRYAHQCNVEAWLDFLLWAKQKKNSYFLGTGDYDDLASYSEREAINRALLHDETRLTLDDIYNDRVNKLVKEISFMKGRLIGLIEGNHYGQFSSGSHTTTQKMCEMLGCKYLGVVSFIRLGFSLGQKRSCIDICVHHGRGVARTVGGSFNTIQQMIDCVEADIYLMAHNHQKGVAMKTRLFLQSGKGNLKVAQRKIILGRTGSFLKGYVDGEGSYVARAMLSPSDIGVIKLEMTPKRNQKENKDNFYIDLHCSV